MGTVPMPPWLRRIQQSWYWQVIGLPLVVGFVTASAPCMVNGIQHIGEACLFGAANATIVSFITVIVSGHSAGSLTFNPDGTINQAVVKLVTTQKLGRTP